MVFKKIDPVDNKPRYIKGSGNFYYWSRDPSGGLEELPEGWEISVNKRTGHLILRKK